MQQEENTNTKKEVKGIRRYVIIIAILIPIFIISTFYLIEHFKDRKAELKKNNVEQLWTKRCENLTGWILCGDNNNGIVGTDEEVNGRFSETFGLLEIGMGIDSRYSRSSFIQVLHEMETSKRMENEMNQLKKIIIEYHVNVGQ